MQYSESCIHGGPHDLTPKNCVSERGELNTVRREKVKIFEPTKQVSYGKDGLPVGDHFAAMPA